MQDIREYAKDRENVGNWSAARAAHAVADLREAYNLMANAWSELPEGDRAGRSYIEGKLMATTVIALNRIVTNYDLPEEYLL